MFPQDVQDNQLGQSAYTPLTPASGQATMPLPIQGAGGYAQTQAVVAPALPLSQPVSEAPQGSVPPVPAFPSGIPSITPAVPILQPTVPVYPVGPADHNGSQQTSQNAVQNNIGAESPAEAADGDVIEPEWVNKAKQIVEETRLNPHLQVRKMNILKAEYMKKRYDKDIKFPGE